MENKSSNGWKFFALLFGALLAGVIGLYVYKQQNPDYDPWEEPWENSSSPVDLGLTKDAEEAKEADTEAAAAPEAAGFLLLFKALPPFRAGLFVIQTQKGTIPKNRPFVITPYLALSGERSEWTDACGIKAWKAKAYEGTSSLPQRR